MCLTDLQQIIKHAMAINLTIFHHLFNKFAKKDYKKLGFQNVNFELLKQCEWDYKIAQKGQQSVKGYTYIPRYS